MNARHRQKLLEWLRRYGPAEVMGTLTALVGSFAAFRWTGSEVAAAYGGALGENVGFYGTMLLREFRLDARSARAAGTRYGARAAAVTGAKLLLEFGPAELLDSLIVRPLTMGLATRWLGRAAGVIAGKLVADVTFYVPVIVSYELRQLARRRRRTRE